MPSGIFPEDIFIFQKGMVIKYRIEVYKNIIQIYKKDSY